MNRLTKLRKIANQLKHLPESREKHFSFIIRRNKILSIGWDSYKTHPLSAKFGYWGEVTHAELSCLLNYNAPYQLNKLTFVNVRVSGGMAKPCANCMRLLKKYGVEEVWYTNPETEWAKCNT